MSNPRLESLRNEIVNSLQADHEEYCGNMLNCDYSAEEDVKEFELLLELEFLKRLADAEQIS